MSEHQPFNYKSLDDLRASIASCGVNLPLSDDLGLLAQPVKIGNYVCPNSMVVHPMEGCDGCPDGSPSELTIRRYDRFASGGAGLIWVEACAVKPEGRANPLQLWLNEANVEQFAALVRRIRKCAADSMGSSHRPLLILQLTHSGRYSKPSGKAAPIIAHHSEILDKVHNLPAGHPLITDAELDLLQEAYVAASHLALAAGFDGVDIKACHRYLVSELLASFTREGSRYGGCFENRTRFLFEVMARIKVAVPELLLTCRLNAFDALPYPYGFGASADDPTGRTPDRSEPIQLVRRLHDELGVQLVNISIGNPYYQPHFGRPYDRPIEGGYTPPEHPLQSVERIVSIARQIQESSPGVAIIGTGYSWLRQFYPYVAAGVLANKWATLIGTGRMAFAYPEFARDILTTGKLDPRKSCIACSQCSQIMRDGGQTGCVVRDAKLYAPILREGRSRAKSH